jgi:hypothetical protein
MANARGKGIDNTHLSIDMAEARGFLHRDYIAHCLRWSHVAKFLSQNQRYKTARVLDIGCGVDLPLARMLYSSRYIVTEYVGVDYNRPDKFNMEPFHTGKMPVNAYGGIDAAVDLKHVEGEVTYSVLDDVYKLPTVITCFEVLEHIEPRHCREMLKKIKALLRLDTTAFLSTPCWDPQTGAADNHVSEIKYGAFGSMLEDLGFEIAGNWGTFASQKDYKHMLKGELATAYDKLAAYYDSNYLATIFAPLYPALSRNCLWQVQTARKNYVRKFGTLTEFQNKPWTSSDKWAELDEPRETEVA